MYYILVCIYLSKQPSMDIASVCVQFFKEKRTKEESDIVSVTIRSNTSTYQWRPLSQSKNYHNFCLNYKQTSQFPIKITYPFVNQILRRHWDINVNKIMVFNILTFRNFRCWIPRPKNIDKWFMKKLNKLTHETRFCSAVGLVLSMAFRPVINSSKTTPKL